MRHDPAFRAAAAALGDPDARQAEERTATAIQALAADGSRRAAHTARQRLRAARRAGLDLDVIADLIAKQS